MPRPRDTRIMNATAQAQATQARHGCWLLVLQLRIKPRRVDGKRAQARVAPRLLRQQASHQAQARSQATSRAPKPESRKLQFPSGAWRPTVCWKPPMTATVGPGSEFDFPRRQRQELRGRSANQARVAGLVAGSGPLRACPARARGAGPMLLSGQQPGPGGCRGGGLTQRPVTWTY